MGSTHQTFVKSSGLRWACAMLLVEVPWASRVWDLPFLSVLAPSERYAAKRGKRHKKITEWSPARCSLSLRRWYPEREIVAVADRAYASLELHGRCCKLSDPIAFVRCLGLDFALYVQAPPRRPHQIGRPCLKGRFGCPTFGGGPRSENRLGVHRDRQLVGERGSHRRDRIQRTAVWYSTDLPAVPIRWVLIRDPE